MDNDTYKTEFYPKESTRIKLEPGKRLVNPKELPVFEQDKFEDPTQYIADEGLVDAMNVALALGQPLLLTGEPGVGKTQFAYSAMHWLGFKRLIRFNVKSTTQARDFFYQIDEIKRFRDAQFQNLNLRKDIREPQFQDDDSTTNETNHDPQIVHNKSNDPMEIRNYMKLGPLGEAILRANLAGQYPMLPQPADHNEEERSIVLIDEIDKAPRDIPNDLLNEFEYMEFEVTELSERIRAQQSFRPVLIITSNSERNLPDAFLRRCIYYNITFPGERMELSEKNKEKFSTDALIRIIKARIPGITPECVWMGEALELFRRFRDQGRGVEKRPGTAELLNWLLMLHQRKDIIDTTSLKKSPELFKNTLPILMKKAMDVDIALRIYKSFRKE